MAVDYHAGVAEDRNWIIAETDCDPRFTAKIESIFCLQNGYMGVRAATEERLTGETRGFYVAGVFDAFAGEVTELANIPDWLAFDIECAGDRFTVTSGSLRSYRRALDLKRGLLTREVEWEGKDGRRTRLSFERFVSMVDVHAAVLRVQIQPLNYEGEILIRSGLNGQVTNGGVQHFREGELRLFADDRIAFTTRTQESDIGVAVAAAHVFRRAGTLLEVQEKVETSRRQIFLASRHGLSSGETLEVVKHVSVCTERDPDAPIITGDRATGANVTGRALDDLSRSIEKGYGALRQEHVRRWASIWDDIAVRIEGPDFDQLAIRFAQFHLYQMTPLHDTRLSIAAKGLSGEGYKGHVFWDTEIFMLPFFTFTVPTAARRLLLYRFHTLDGARRKSRANGYAGAMYAWESAATGDEETPKMGSIDILTGAPIRIWTGDIEQHISSDIVYAIWQYVQATGDESFLLDHGLEIMLETARFWASRVTENVAANRLEIMDVIGPDEYGEHVDNNAYTNTMVRWQLERTVEWAAMVQEKHPETWSRLERSMGVSRSECEQWKAMAGRIFTNYDESSGFIRQYDGFDRKKRIDLSPYAGRVGAILRDYGWEQIRQMQVVKQADTVMLLYLLGDRFSKEVRHTNWNYYEPRTLHDSSLSSAIHAIVAADMEDLDKAYHYFLKASRVDLGDDPNSSGEGLHAGSLGGLWQTVVIGFAGVRISGGSVLRICPRLPAGWNALRFHLSWQGTSLQVDIGKNEVAITPRSTPARPLRIDINGKKYTLVDTAGIIVKSKSA